MAYAANGSLTGVTDGAGAWSYGYDDFNRMSSAARNGSTAFAESFDRYSNRWTQAVTPGATTRTPTDNLTNRVAAGNGVAHDALGNITSETVGVSTYTYAYDAENRLVGSQEGGSLSTYKFDALGRRTYISSGGNTELYAYDLAGRAVVAMDVSGTLRRTEIYAGGQHLGSLEGVVGMGGYYVASLTNLLGTVRKRLRFNNNTNGGWYEGQDCTTNPYGDGLACASAQGWTNPLTFSRVHYAGYEYNGSTGLYHTWFREYDPRLGRFLQADPLGGDASDPQSLNRFAYVGNNPGNAIDPFGLQCVWNSTDNTWVDDTTDPPCDKFMTGSEIVYVNAGKEPVVIFVKGRFITCFPDSPCFEGYSRGGGSGGRWGGGSGGVMIGAVPDYRSQEQKDRDAIDALNRQADAGKPPCIAVFADTVVRGFIDDTLPGPSGSSVGSEIRKDAAFAATTQTIYYGSFSVYGKKQAAKLAARSVTNGAAAGIAFEFYYHAIRGIGAEVDALKSGQCAPN